MIVRLYPFVAFAGLLVAQQSDVDQAWKLASAGRQSEAIQLLNGVVQKNPRDADARLLLGSLFTEAGDRSQAITQLEAAVQLRPRSAEAENALGEAYNAFGDAKAARNPFERAIALNPRFAPAQLNLGMVLVSAGEFAAAATHLDQAIALLSNGEDAAYAHYLRAKVYTASNDLRKATAQLEKAVTLRVDFREAWSDLADARKALQDDPGTLAALKRNAELAPGDAKAQYRLGAEYLSQGNSHQAVEYLAAANRLDPSDQPALSALVIALRRDGKAEESDKAKQQLTELIRHKQAADQTRISAIQLNDEGAKLQKDGDFHGAADKYRQALDLYPENVTVRVNYAVALLRLANWTEGLNQLHDALTRDPGNAKIKAALADALAQAPSDLRPKWAEDPQRK
jgi:protein O-GlcNAc transferase